MVRRKQWEAESSTELGSTLRLVSHQLVSSVKLSGLCFFDCVQSKSKHDIKYN